MPQARRSRTVVIAAGVARAQIVAPSDDPVLGPGAKMLQEVIQARTGVALPIIEPADALRQWPPSKAQILLGVLGTNAAIEKLYFGFFTLVDHNFPGPDGFAIQTTFSPWGTTADALILAATGARPLARSIARLVDLLAWDNDEIYIGYTNTVDAPDMSFKNAGQLWPRTEPGVPKDPGTYFLWLRDEAQRITQPQSQTHHHHRLDAGGLLLAHGCCAATYYLMSGKTVFLDCFYTAIKAHAKLTTVGDQSHQHLYHALALWDLIWANPHITDPRRELISRRLLELVESDQAIALSLTTSPHPATSAQPKPAALSSTRQALSGLTAFFAARHFGLRHNHPRAAQWLAFARGTFEGQSRLPRPLNDSALEQGRIMSATATYALASADTTFFDTETCRTFCRALMTLRANRGDIPGFGSSEPGPKLPVGLIAAAAHVYQRSRYLGAIHGHQRPLGRGFATPMKPTDPALENIGVQKVRLAAHVHQHLTALNPTANLPPAESCFDKLGFRAGSGLDDEFLLLSGTSGLTDGHNDTNSVLELSVFGRQFIVEEEHTVQGHKADHNAVTHWQKNVTLPEPVAAALEQAGDLPAIGFSVTSLCGPGTAHWKRLILWCKGRCFLIFDDVSPAQSGHVRYQSTWRSLGQPTVEQGTLRLRQGPAAQRAAKRPAAGQTEFFIVPADTAQSVIESEAPATAAGFVGYPNAAPQITRLTRTIKGHRQAQQQDTFITGLFWRKGADEAAPTVHRVAPTAAFIIDKGHRALGWVLPQNKEGQRLLGLQLTARAGWIEDDRLILFGARLFWCRFLSFSASNPVNIQWSRTQGLIVESQAQTELRFRMGPDRYTLAVDAGRHDLGRFVIELPDLFPVMEMLQRAIESSDSGASMRGANPDLKPWARRKTTWGATLLSQTIASITALTIDTAEPSNPRLGVADESGSCFIFSSDGKQLSHEKHTSPVHGLQWQHGTDGSPTLHPAEQTVQMAEDEKHVRRLLDRQTNLGSLNLGALNLGRAISLVKLQNTSTELWAVVTDSDLIAVIRPDFKSAEKCEEIWSAPTGSKPRALLAAMNGRLYVGTEKGRVLAFDSQTGKRLGRAKLPAPISFLASAADKVFATSADGVYRVTI